MKKGDTYYHVPRACIRGRKPFNGEALTNAEHQRRHRQKKKEQRREMIAVLDFETDPFDSEAGLEIAPFAACLYSENFDPIVIWDNNPLQFVEQVISAIESLPGVYTIFAHNGGKFDFMFLIHKLRGFVKFKGRGIMSAKIGDHHLRDSFHIVPEKLANYKKDDMDYSLMRKDQRDKPKNKKKIIRYMVQDCVYLFEIVQKFVSEHGLKLSIGQAAMFELKKHYTVDRIGDHMDTYLRKYFFGGRVECIAGRGHFKGEYKMYDVNSMYPYVMAEYLHPIGNEFLIRRGEPDKDTCFIDLECFNYGGLIRRGAMGETEAAEGYGRFFTSIWEYEIALRYGLIVDVKINRCVDCMKRSGFPDFVYPLYENRLKTKAELKRLDPGSELFNEVKKDDIFYKLLLNNAYGKFAQNPRRFKESYITDADKAPPENEEGFGDMPVFRNSQYAIWERPARFLKFNNVATAASITGAARAVLLEAIQNSVDPVYCDTDSLICKDLKGFDLDAQRLGAWDLEAEFSEVLIAGKKLYACKRADLPDGHKDQIKVRSKGVAGLNWKDIQQLLDEQIIEVLQKAPTLTKTGKQFYMTRNIRATAPVRERRTIRQHREAG